MGDPNDKRLTVLTDEHGHMALCLRAAEVAAVSKQSDPRLVAVHLAGGGHPILIPFQSPQKATEFCDLLAENMGWTPRRPADA